MSDEAVGLGYHGEAPVGVFRPAAAGVAVALSFVKAADDRDIGDASRAPTGDSAVVMPEQENESSQQPQQQPPEDEALQRAARAQEGRLRAQAILRRFEEQQASFLLVPQPAAVLHSPPEEQQQQPSVYVEQRRRAAIRERRRQQVAWSRNFAYVYDKHAAAAQAFPAARLAAQEREAVAARDYQRVLAARQRQQTELTTAQAGIGTQKRQRAEAHARTTRAVALSAALYLTGIPVEDSNNSNGFDSSSSRPDLMLRQIFGAYGQLTKIHLYRDKTTGALKGDGLVVYQVPSYAARDALVETVCGQVRPYGGVDGALQTFAEVTHTHK
jgi:hypothetical protein